MLTFAVRFDMPVRELAVDFVSPPELRVDFSMSPVVLAVDFKGLLFRDIRQSKRRSQRSTGRVQEDKRRVGQANRHGNIEK